jgi:hypothetical protein
LKITQLAPVAGERSILSVRTQVRAGQLLGEESKDGYINSLPVDRSSTGQGVIGSGRWNHNATVGPQFIMDA